MNKDSSPWITLARIVRPQGRHGEVIAELWTDFPEKFAERKQVFLARPQPADASLQNEEALAPKPAEIVDFRVSGLRVVLHFAGVHSIEAAETLRDYEVVIRESERAPLEADAAYISDLIGCEVFDHGQPVGRVVQVDREASSVDLLVIEGEDGALAEIPFVKAFLLELDVAGRRIAMQLPEGLLTVNARKLQEPQEAGKRGDKARRKASAAQANPAAQANKDAL